ncbi:MAG TPA: universal stress protein [Candidatus Babeliales bacterium]|nr:universal stress protein [Candidatus Babeliales bacterium]
MFKHILVAVDGSETSNLAMQTAIKLAKDQHAVLHVVHVADEFLDVSEGVAIDFDKYEKSIRDHGQVILHKMEALADEAKIAVKIHLIEITDYADHIPEKLVEAANIHHADLMIIGTHGRRGFRRFLLGSVAEGVARLASVPVLLIRGKIKD